ncbi:phosphoesterase [Thermocladium modestius]|uniref:Phosphoesterase n=1 Tax=Thermocladium modestius TaxID=62609 RepID=A0A830GUP0_9CREN|nr:phosphoglucomutase/phosphomannomutase family protein [Thermocladium modestius]GGP20605.1 phosphoesterase [Thermocladium modestius]
MNVRFGTDGVRGIIDSTFNELVVATIVEAALRHWSRQYGATRLLVGYDTRRKSKEYAEVAAVIAASHGFDALVVDSPTPTPTVAWAVKSMGFHLGFQITASHNPPQYNGIKIITMAGSSAFPNDTDEVEKIIRDEGDDIIKSIRDVPSKSMPTVSLKDPYIDYILSWLESRVDINKSLNVIVDPMHGAAVGYTSKILESLGMRVKEIHGFHDSSFGGLEPEPEERNLGEMINAVASGDFDLGIAHDGDADRLAVAVKGLGFLGANRIIPIMINKLNDLGLIRRGLGRTVATTHLVDCLASRFGVPLYETPVGIKYISELIIDGKIDIGGEESGGLAYSWHVPEKDGIYSGSLFASLIDGNASVELDRITSICGTMYSSRIDMAMQNSKEFVASNGDAIIDSLSSLGEVSKVVRMDGIKVIYADGSWLLIRGSGTEPKLRIYAETKSRESTEELLKRAISIISKLGSVKGIK